MIHERAWCRLASLRGNCVLCCVLCKQGGKIEGQKDYTTTRQRQRGQRHTAPHHVPSVFKHTNNIKQARHRKKSQQTR